MSTTSPSGFPSKNGMPGTIHLCIGQEASAVGVCANLNPDDYLTSTHRPHGHAIAKGVGVDAMMALQSSIGIQHSKQLESHGRAAHHCRGNGTVITTR